MGNTLLVSELRNAEAAIKELHLRDQRGAEQKTIVELNEEHERIISELKGELGARCDTRQYVSKSVQAVYVSLHPFGHAVSYGSALGHAAATLCLRCASSVCRSKFSTRTYDVL